MWNWLKKRREADQALRIFMHRMIEPQTLAAALAETVRDYVGAAAEGKLSIPAHKREGASVREVWADLRIEALRMLFGFGKADSFLLADMRSQDDLLNCLLDDRAHLEFPQPRGEVIPDTIQAIFQVYRYLDSAGSELGDRETDHDTLKSKGRSILDRFESDCVKVRSEWIAFRSSPGGGSMPETIIEILYADVTEKAKSIALSKVFGPVHESGIRYVESLLGEDSEGLKNFQRETARILDAKDPDRLTDLA